MAWVDQARTWLGSRAARPLRFACTGGVAAAAQLALLHALLGRGWVAMAAEVVALLVSTQVNFALSSLFTWRDRRLASPFGLALLTRWVTYQWSGAGAAALNMVVFALARLDLSVLAAAALGTLVAGAANFVAGDRLVFRERPVY